MSSSDNMNFFDPDDTSRFSKLDIFTVPYKHVRGHPITVDVLVPKHLTVSSRAPGKPNPSPVIIRIHGGGLVGGSSLFPGFFAPWHFELAERHSAIIVSPDYRLMPEATAMEVLEDLEDLWDWVQQSLGSFLEAQTGGRVAADTGRIITAGDSAGGYLSLQLGLSHPDKIRAVTAAYPLLDLTGKFFHEELAPKKVLNLPTFPKNVYIDHMKQLGEQGDSTGFKPILTSDSRLERAPLVFCMCQYNLFRNHFPTEQRQLFPADRLDDGARFPEGGVLIWHGRDDSIVPVEGTSELEKKVRELAPDAKFNVIWRDGDHGFDAISHIDDQWMSEGFENILKAWLA